MDSLDLQQKIYNQFDVKYPPAIACSDGTVFMYSTANGLIRLFLTGAENNIELQKSPFDSRATSIGLSPAHTFGVVCYEDGSILIYNLIHKKIAKSLSKQLKGPITHVTFVSDVDFITLDSKLELTLFTLVSMSIFGYTVKSFKLHTFTTVPFKLVSPPVNRSIDEIPEHLSSTSYCYAPKFNYVAGISLSKQLIIAKFKPTYQVIFQTSEDSLIEKPYLTFSLPNADTLYAGYSTTKEIIVLSITMDSSNNYSTKVIFQKPNDYKIRFLSFFSTSFISMVTENNQFLLYNFLQPDENCITKSIRTDGIFFGDFGKIDVFTQNNIVTYYLTSFASRIAELDEDDKFEEIIELAKKAANGDPESIVGLSTDPQIRYLEIEKLTNGIFKKHLESRKNFVMKDLADRVVELMIEIKNRGFVANDALPIFNEWRGTKEFFTSVLNHDPKGEKFTYNQKFVKDIIDKYEQDEYFQKDEEKQHYFNQIKTFLLSLPPKIAKPKWLIDFSLKRKDYMMTIEVCTNRIYDPIMALNLLESVQQTEMIPDIFLNKVFKGNIEMIEWIVAPEAETNKFTRLKSAIKTSPEKMVEVFKWMNEEMGKVQSNSRIEKENLTSSSSSSSLLQTQENKIKPKSSNDNSKTLVLLKDLYIYLKEMKGKESIEDDDENPSLKLHENQLSESSIALAQKKEVVKTSVTKSKLTNDYYVNAVIMTLIDMKIGYKTQIFKEIEEHVIKNCPDTFSNPSLKYLIESAFSKEYNQPDLRETLLSSLIFNGHAISNQLSMSLLSLCEQFDYKEASSFIMAQQHLFGDLLKSIIFENGLDAALSFINANYRDDLQSMEDIENVVIYYAPYFIEHNCGKFVDVLNNIRFRILYTDLSKSISDADLRLSFMRQLYVKFEPPKIERNDSGNIGYVPQFLKGLTNKLWGEKKSEKKSNEDPITQVYKAFSRGDLDTFYALAEEFFGVKSKLILPIILKNMSPEKLNELQQKKQDKLENGEGDDQTGQKRLSIQIASNLMNSAILLNIQKTIETEIAKREERAKLQSEQEKAQQNDKEQQKLDDYFSKAKTELESQAKVIIPFVIQYFPQDVITIMRKFPAGLIESKDEKVDENDDDKQSKSIVEICKDAGLYDCCAYYEALNGDFESATNYLRTVIVIDPIQYQETIIDTCKLIFNQNKTTKDDQNNQKQDKKVGGWDDKKDENDEEEEEEEAKDDNNNNNSNGESHDILMKRATFILQSFALQFKKVNSSKKFEQIAFVYRKVCDAIEISKTASFEEILLMTKKIYGGMQKDAAKKFRAITRALIVNRIYSGDFALKARDFVKLAVAKSLSNNDDDDDEEPPTIDNSNEELNEVLNSLTCASCKLRILAKKEPIAILQCGHAIHYKSYCCPEATNNNTVIPMDNELQRNLCNLNIKCPICSKPADESGNNQ